MWSLHHTSRAVKCFCSVQQQSLEASNSKNNFTAVIKAKESLRTAIITTNRGGRASSSQRGIVEEAQVALEALSDSLDYSKLAGKWRILYTTAPDVAPLLASERLNGLLPLQAGNIYQEFSSVAVGQVKNIIELSIPFLLEKDDGVTVTVKADYEVRSARRIALTFQEAGIGDIRISQQLEALLAPALLPRGWLTHRLLLAIREFQLRVPLRRQLPTALRNGADRLARNVGSEYLLTYLDDDTLIGRQTGSGGTFIFERAGQ